MYDVCGNDNIALEQKPLGSSPVLRAPDTPFDELRDQVVCVPTVLSEDYLSNEAVRKAIHVDHVNRTEWTECYNLRYNRSIPSLLETVYPRLIQNMNVSMSHTSMSMPELARVTCCSPVWRCLCYLLSMSSVALLIDSGRF